MISTTGKQLQLNQKMDPVYITEQTGEDVSLTRNELKKLGDINEIDETLEMINDMELGKVYTDDMLNFIDKNELGSLSEDFRADYEEVNFVVE